MILRNRAAGRWPEMKPGTNPMGGLVFGERSWRTSRCIKLFIAREMGSRQQKNTHDSAPRIELLLFNKDCERRDDDETRKY
jgi:hypothetical protein